MSREANQQTDKEITSKSSIIAGVGVASFYFVLLSRSQLETEREENKNSFKKILIHGPACFIKSREKNEKEASRDRLRDQK